MEIYNEELQELVEARHDRLERLTPARITGLVFNSLDLVDQGSSHNLQGIDAATDGITKVLWEAAAETAFQNGELAGIFKDGQAPKAVWPYEEVLIMIGKRVAAAILVIHGMTEWPS